MYCLLSTPCCLGEDQHLKELNQALTHIEESYYGPVDMEAIVDSTLQAVLVSLDKDSKVVKGIPPSLDFVRGLEEEDSIAEARLISPESGKATPIAYIKVSFFGRRTGPHFRKALETLGAASDSGYNPPVPPSSPPGPPFSKGGLRGIKGLLLDLRDNPGGHLQSALEMLEIFVPPGKVLLIEKTKDGEKRYHAEGDHVLQLPIVVLINGSTASSAEVVAATLRYYCEAKIVGEKSKAKGTIQQVIPLGTRTLILTTGQYLLPDSSSLKDNGVLPDVEVKGSEEQLQAALSLFQRYTRRTD